MITINIDWSKEMIRIEDLSENVFGNVRFSDVDIDQIERTDSLACDYINAVMNMYENDMINMIRDE